ncbi:MAG TPA: DUF4190 domain-containing protein [Phycisphaerae bacterium]|nr:DUF4190 domain-containing protein [Phycisphaerae bacterium]
MTAPQSSFEAPSSFVSAHSGMATAALVCGIIGFLTALLVVGIIPGILAIVFAFVAMARMARNPALRGRGMAIAGLVMGFIAVAIAPLVLLMAALLVPSLSRAREMANRAACAANQRAIMEGLLIYANQNQDTYPYTPYAPLSSANAGVSTETTGAASDLDALAYLGSGKSAQNGSPLAAAWMLVLQGQCLPRNFVCKSDPFANAPAPEPAGAYPANFQSDDQISYSLAYPYLVKPAGASVGSWWRDSSDASLPIVSDMAPLNGTGRPARNVSAGAPSRLANSGNHLGDGQNVGFADAHVEFFRYANLGQDSDNLFTVGSSGATASGTQPAIGPIQIQTDSGPYDIVVLPPRNLNTGKLW